MSCENEKRRVEVAEASLEHALSELGACVLAGEQNPFDPSQPTSDCSFENLQYVLAEQELNEAQNALRACENGFLTQPGIHIVEGRVTFLRVHDRASGYGPPGDRIEGEVVFKLDTVPGKAFGFELRDNKNYPQGQGMLSLLRDAFIHGFLVRADYITDKSPQNNHRAFRIELTNPAPARAVAPGSESVVAI